MTNKPKPDRKKEKELYRNRPEVKARMLKYRNRPEIKAREKLRRQKPENASKNRACAKEYSQRPEVIAIAKKHRDTPEYKARVKAYKIKNKEMIQRNNKRYRDKHKAEDKIYNREKVATDKLIVYNAYCNNDIKCKCCGEKDMTFLSLDHIANDGAEFRRMLQGSMYAWVIRNNFPAKGDKYGLQVLCMNCNWARRYNKRCPHEIKSKNRIWNTIISMFTGGWRL